MKDNKLISMVSFVLNQANVKMESVETVERQVVKEYFKLIDYAQFLSQPLTLGMFVPCIDGEPMEEPENYDIWLMGYLNDVEQKDYIQFEQAQSRVLFEGFVMYSNMANVVLDCNSLETIDLSEHSDIESIVDFQPTLTETALKQINL